MMTLPRTQSVECWTLFSTGNFNIYWSNREKERDEYRKAQIEEETKIKLLQDLEKKDFFFDKTDNQKERIIDDIEHGRL